MTFNEEVYALVRHIPPGKVLTYGRVAVLLGVPHGARAVGWALHGLPDASDVPWHRVVNASGGISLRGPGDAPQQQRIRLEAEGVIFDDTGHINLSKSGGTMWLPSPWEVQDLLDQTTP